MTIQELKNWMSEQLEQGNSIAVITAGQGGSGYAMTNNKAILEDVDHYDDNEISIVEDSVQIVFVKDMLRGEWDSLELYDAVVRLSDGTHTIYVLYDNNEAPYNVSIEKGSYNTGDTLTFEYMGKEYSVSGEFEVNEWGNLRHTFVAPTGKEFEIVTPYE